MSRSPEGTASHEATRREQSPDPRDQRSPGSRCRPRSPACGQGRIAAETGLSPATVTGITARLLSAGLITEAEAVRTTGGRPARLLGLGTDAVLAAGVRLSNTEAYVVLVNLRGEVVASHREPLASTRPQDVGESVARAVRLATASRASSTLIGVGVAVSGVVDQQGGVVRHSGTMGWENVPFQHQLTALADTPVVLDSYVNSVASGLLLFDGRLTGRSLMIFSVGASLGASVVVQGRIHRGFSGTAGGSRTPVSVRGRGAPVTAALRTASRPGPANGGSSASWSGAARQRRASSGAMTTSSRAPPTDSVPPWPTPPSCSAPSA